MALGVTASAHVEEFGEERTHGLPFVGVQTVFHLGRFFDADDKTGLAKLFKMLGNSGFSHWETFVDIIEVTVLMFGEEMHDCESRGMRESLGIAGEFLVMNL